MRDFESKLACHGTGRYLQGLLLICVETALVQHHYLQVGLQAHLSSIS